MSSRLGVDVGGTFTDLLLFNEQNSELRLLKTPSTPQDQSIGIMNGISQLIADTGIAAPEINALLHGTTISTNTVLEEKGAKVGLLVTKDFEQVLHLARSQTPGPLAGWMIMEKPDPLADLELTRGIPERISAHGDVLTPLDEAAAREAVRELIDAGVESITVSLLHSYANPDHERRLRTIIDETAPDIPISLSSDILPEFREYERTLVTVMNAYVGPSMQRYLASFEEKLKTIQFSPHVNIVRSDGGLMSVMRASDSPVHTMLSGPAGGVSGAAYVATLAGHGNALGFDMGGTSTDVSLIQNGEPLISRQTSLGHYPIKIPSVEVHSVGAGGGSIAHVPMTGALRVGPESAGAAPGPACYGRGGEQPTVTDANLLLGRLPPQLLDGRMVLDIKAAEEVVGKIARALGLDLHQAAKGILDIVNENMFGALRLVSVQKGLDPRDFALIAFGGAGPLHGNAMAILGNCYPVIVPPTPGVLSALGFLYSDVKNEFAQTYVRNISDVDGNQLGEIYDRLGREARGWLREEGIDDQRQELNFQADVRYFRQGYEFALQVNPDSLSNGGLSDLEARFGDAHERLYGFRLEQPVELVNLRAVGTGGVEKVHLPSFDLEGADASAAMVEQHRVYFDGGFVNANIYDRKSLRAGHRITGPAVVTQADATTVIHPGHIATVDSYLNILISPEGGQPA
ncbi:MAG: hydantoinase/oxoprolinase family protein [Alphaproteobacteria bacterium]|nr:hydantoinase/oxoprolinase family protein [Alphaproteobacteria bacterium]MDP6253383.1 hydantoinase/oxoprolinase family protein [Alphaproteobacteria bacterium]MDP7055487.1 hydantoinase/oxoprolinase family protein [Alphaproteobacteria bacterium]MDP7227986.1 hydantoinase/oxoprolinase family protein [Alphaproteobacteria bacterium]MDP7461681.1 hydantoinase/oxoprolinase family protein [Alphaproteobacteria bacterium]|tara:strand:+ start:17227 stop:19287 length:2061 start_codon:yes stop_codon:yes gene_type:complete